MWNENEKDNDYDVVILLSIYTSTMKFIKKNINTNPFKINISQLNFNKNLL